MIYKLDKDCNFLINEKEEHIATINEVFGSCYSSEHTFPMSGGASTLPCVVKKETSNVTISPLLKKENSIISYYTVFAPNRELTTITNKNADVDGHEIPFNIFSIRNGFDNGLPVPVYSFVDGKYYLKGYLPCNSNTKYKSISIDLSTVRASFTYAQEQFDIGACFVPFFNNTENNALFLYKAYNDYANKTLVGVENCCFPKKDTVIEFNSYYGCDLDENGNLTKSYNAQDLTTSVVYFIPKLELNNNKIAYIERDKYITIGKGSTLTFKFIGDHYIDKKSISNFKWYKREETEDKFLGVGETINILPTSRHEEYYCTFNLYSAEHTSFVEIVLDDIIEIDPDKVKRYQKTVFLYEFDIGDDSYMYTNADSAVLTDDGLFEPIPISHSEIQHDPTEITKEIVTITASNKCDLGQATIKFFDNFTTNVIIKKYIPQIDKILIEWSGILNSVSIKLTDIEFECGSLLFDTQRQGLRQIYQRRCPFCLYDQQCKVNKLAHKFEFPASSLGLVDSFHVSVKGSVFDSSLAGGMIELENSACYYIRAIDDNGNLFVNRPLYTKDLYGTVKMYQGCDRSIKMCRDRFDNDKNFGGYPIMPLDNPARVSQAGWRTQKPDTSLISAVK